MDFELLNQLEKEECLCLVPAPGKPDLAGDLWCRKCDGFLYNVIEEANLENSAHELRDFDPEPFPEDDFLF